MYISINLHSNPWSVSEDEKAGGEREKQMVSQGRAAGCTERSSRRSC